MRGSVIKRCQCRDSNGKKITNCRKAHGSWQYTVDAGTDPTTGKRRQTTRGGFRTKSDAEEALNAELTKLNAGTWTDDRRMTVGKWLDQWLDELAAAKKSVNTLKNYRGHVRDAWKPLLGHVLLRDLRRSHIEGVLATLAAPVESARPAGNVGRRVTHRTAATIDGYRRTCQGSGRSRVRWPLIVLVGGQQNSMPVVR